MQLVNRSALRNFCRQNQLFLNKKWGQNFLVDEAVLENILATADLKPHDQVVEIGAGLGVLTQALAQKVKKVRALESDRKIFPLLQKNLNSQKNVELIWADARTFRPQQKNFKLIANLPYYLTSPLLRHFLVETANLPKLVVLLVQREVAEKICARPLSLLSLAVRVFGEPQIITKVGSQSFWPMPKVQSAILKITPYTKKILSPQIWPAFFRLVGAGFHAPRKKIRHSLRLGLKVSSQQVGTILTAAEIEPDLRPAELTLVDWQRLYQKFKNFARDFAQR